MTLIFFTEELYNRVFLTGTSVAVAGSSTSAPTSVETKDNQISYNLESQLQRAINAAISIDTLPKQQWNP